jgi:alkaline phosphatase
MTPRRRLLVRVFIVLSLVAAVIAFTQAPQKATAKTIRTRTPVKNVIVMIADGAGFNQYLAADYYQYGQTGRQVYHSFPTHVAVSTYEYEWKTWSADGKTPLTFELGSYDSNKYWSDFGYAIQTNPLNAAYINTATDSASSATAMATGFKTRDGAIGVDVNGNEKTNVVEIAESQGLSTGLVTSVPFNHATPSGFGAHNISRDNYDQLANQMIYNSGLEVLMGCSAPDYGYDGEPTATSSSRLKYVGGATTWADFQDGSVQGADADGDGIADAWSVIRDKSQFQAMATGDTPKRVIGLPKVYQSLQYYRKPIYSKADVGVDPITPNIPTLEEMTKAALNVLDSNKKGFFLMVEGGAVDWAAHFYQPGRMIEEQIDFNHSVEAVVDWVEKNSNWEETIVIVAADHETSYLWGPGSNPAFKEIVNNGAGKMPGMQFYSDIGGFGWHSNSLVPLYAKGSAARIIQAYATKTDSVRGPYIDNTDIFKIIRFCLM